MKELATQILLFATILLLRAAAKSTLVLVTSDLRIAPIPENATVTTSINSVFRRRCGGHGKVLDLRVFNCSSQVQCRVSHGTTVSSEMDFIPSESIPVLGLRLNLVKDGEIKTIFESLIRQSKVEAGQGYTLFAQGSPTKELEGTRFTYQIILYRANDSSIEVCRETVFQVD